MRIDGSQSMWICTRRRLGLIVRRSRNSFLCRTCSLVVTDRRLAEMTPGIMPRHILEELHRWLHSQQDHRDMDITKGILTTQGAQEPTLIGRRGLYVTSMSTTSKYSSCNHVNVVKAG
jgi:cell division FtsZ-interacting protein ZapD